jgi:predicted O-methyltransferase YrrM
MPNQAGGRSPVSSAYVALALLSHLQSPAIWPEIARYLRRFVEKRTGLGQATLQEEREAASAWCAEQAVNITTALATLGISAAPTELKTLFPDIVDAARARAGHGPLPLYEMGLGLAGHSSLLHCLCAHMQARRVLETGVAFGWSSLAILLALRDRPDALLVSTDMPYLWLRADEWVGGAVPDELRAHWLLLRKPDRLALPEALAHGPFDLCHYDSDKSVSGRLWAYPRIWARLRPGGLLVSDDIDDNRAWRTFCEKVGQRSLVIRKRHKFVGILAKPLTTGEI